MVKAYLIVNFGGPRSLQEVEPFLRSLLTDKDVIKSNLPQPLHNLIFNRVAKKRSKIISHDYAKIGDGSPIWMDTEYIAEALRPKLQAPVLAFHRYLTATHSSFIEDLKNLECTEIIVFPMFPQFTYATTGSIARFFQKNIPSAVLRKMRWVKSYPSHPAFIQSSRQTIQEFLTERGIREEETFFIFSAHGLPKILVEEGDLYAYECRSSYAQVMKAFPKAHSLLCFQSKFGKGEWLRPYTVDVCEEIEKYTERRQCVFVPISFTSDHIETLFEVEEQYMPILAKKGYIPSRVPALNRREDWVDAIVQILADFSPCTTSMLVRH